MHLDKNSIEVTGTIVSEIEDAYEFKGVKMKRFYIESKRLADTSDTLLVVVKERNLPSSFKKGARVTISGEIRMYTGSTLDFLKTRTVYAVFAKDVLKAVTDTDSNSVTLVGYPVIVRDIRHTLSGRILREVVIAVNSYYSTKNGFERSKSQYINCIAWNKTVNFFEGIDTQTPIEIKGRFQSRDYTKQTSDEVYTTYEVAISSACDMIEENVQAEAE